MKLNQKEEKKKKMMLAERYTHCVYCEQYKYCFFFWLSFGGKKKIEK